MSNTTTEFMLNEVYPNLYPSIPDLLPEFEFTQKGGKYESTNRLKLDGTSGDSRGKVHILAEKPGVLFDSRPGSSKDGKQGVSIWDYIQDRDNLTDQQVIRLLAEKANVQPPERELSQAAIDKIKDAKRKAEIWEEVNKFFIDCLTNQHNPHFRTNRRALVTDYLLKTRGYTADLLSMPGEEYNPKAPRMELGYIPSTAHLEKHLRNSGVTEAEAFLVRERLERICNNAVNARNILTFPYRDHTGDIKGMAFRSIDPSPLNYKYIYTEGEWRGQILFNLRAITDDKDVCIVESPLDAMHAGALGIRNIVALGGASLNSKQIALMVRFGVRKITLMLDNDNKNGKDGTGVKATDKIIQDLQKEAPFVKVYVAEYPDGIKDLDELLIKEGVEGFKSVKGDAVAAWLYQLNRLFTSYTNQAKEGEYLTDKQTDDLLQDVVHTSARLDAFDRDLFIASFISNPAIKELGVTKQSIDDAVEEIRQTALKKKQLDSLNALLSEAKKAGDSGDVHKALNLLDDKAREIKGRNKADTFTLLTATRTEQHVRQAIQSRPAAMETGLSISNEPLLISSSAITILAGATNHGKSILIANLAINMAELYPDKTFHIFSYEVNEEQYLINLLNPYIGDNELAVMNNRESIEHYFRGKKFITRKSGTPYRIFKDDSKDALFDCKRVEFFTNLIETGKIKVHYVDYDSDTLIDAINYLNKVEPVGAILVDYVQLIYAPANRSRYTSRQEEIKQMCQDFNRLAQRSGLPLIFGAQFNREVGNLAQMHASKLGEAGDLERIADQIIAVWNCAKKFTSIPTSSEAKIIAERIAITDDKVCQPSDPTTWYVEILKGRARKSDTWDIWDYLGNAGKITSNPLNK